MSRIRTFFLIVVLALGAFAAAPAVADAAPTEGPSDLVTGLSQCAGLAVLFPDLFVSCSVGVVSSEVSAGVDAAGAVAQCAGLVVVLPHLFVECVVGVVT